MRRILSLAAVLLFLAAPSDRGEITVLAAASLTDALSEIGRDFERRYGITVRFSFAASSTLARQIAEGAPADIFFSADEAKMNELAARGQIAVDTRFPLLSNSLAIVVGKGSSFPGLIRVRSLALAEPSTVPAGVYARRFLQREGLWQELRERVVPTENVRAALAAVEAGNVQAAIVYTTDARSSRQVRVVRTIPMPEISYPVAALKEAEHPKEARIFLSFLRGSEARAVFLKHGFIVR